MYTYNTICMLLQLMLARQGTGWNAVDLCLVNSGGLRVQINPGS